MSRYDHVELGPLWDLTPRHAASGGADRIGAAIWESGGGEIWGEPDPQVSVIGMSMANYDIEVFKDGRLAFAGAWPPGKVQIMIAGVRPRAVFKSPWRLLHVYLPTRLLEHAAGGTHHGDIRDPLGEADRQFERLLQAVADELAYPTGPQRLSLDGLGLALASHLVFRGGRPPASPIAADWRVRRAVDYLDAHLADDVGLAELADVVNLSITQISALFRAGTGEPPHRWLMRRRFERACEMLGDPRPSVTDVAHACGFASSQHLATVFRRRLGVTPSEYRRARLS